MNGTVPESCIYTSRGLLGYVIRCLGSQAEEAKCQRLGCKESLAVRRPPRSESCPQSTRNTRNGHEPGRGSQAQNLWTACLREEGGER